MKFYNAKFVLFFIGACFLLAQSSVSARILTKDEVGQADTQALVAETDVFKSIGMGIALSIANCEGTEDCKPAVDREEVKQLLGALDERIAHLQELAGTEEISEEQLNQILTAYVDERENYLRYLDQLGKFSPAEEESIGQPASGQDVFRDIDEEVEDYSVFEDTDSEITDESEPGLEEDIPEEL